MRAFTLIETIIYIALLAVLMGGIVATAWNLFESNARARTVAVVQEEGDYLMGKVQWALYGAKAVTVPQATLSGNALTVVKWDTSAGNPIQICLAGTSVRMATTTGVNCISDGVVLNNADVQISNMLFTHATSSGDGINPESVSTSFDVSGITPQGSRVFRTFTSIVYLRQ